MFGLTLTSEKSHEGVGEREKNVSVGKDEVAGHFYAFGENAYEAGNGVERVNKDEVGNEVV